MKIAYLAHRVPYPPNKGEKIRTFHQIKYLAEQGHEICVFAPTNSVKDIEDLSALESAYCKNSFHAPAPGFSSMITGLVANKPLSVAHFYTSRLQQQFDKYIRDQGVDAVVCTSSSMAEYIFRSHEPSLKHISLVMDFMDLDSDKWNQYRKIKPFPLSLIYQREAFLISRFEKKIYQFFDSVMFISKNEVDLFVKLVNDSKKVHVIGNGMDTNTFKPSNNEKRGSTPVFLFTGVMDYLPNEDAVIWFVDNCWENIKLKYPAAEFYIVGMNPSAKVRDLEKYSGVTVTGFVDDITEYYEKSNCFIAPFRLARGVQNKVLQAFACGLTTISTTLGCEGINCEDGKHVLIADSVKDILEKVDWAVSNPNEAAELGKNAARLIKEEYSWESKLSSFEAILGHHSLNKESILPLRS